jgi:hypothetical protein
MRTFMFATLGLGLLLAPVVAEAKGKGGSYCKAFTQAECTADKGCAWRTEHAAGDINPKSGKAYKRAAGAACHFSPKDAQEILAKQFGKK